MRLSLSFTIFISTVFFTSKLVDSANILFFYGGGTYSHKFAVWPLALALADRGHNITFISPHNRRPWTHQNITDVIPLNLEKLLSVFHLQDKLEQRMLGEERRVWLTLSDWSLNICKTLLQDDYDSVMRPIIHNSTFDLIFINACFGECAYVMNQVWKAKVILVDSTTLLPYFSDILGINPETSWVPDISSQFVYPMSFMDKVRNFFYSVASTYDRRMNLYPQLEQLTRDLVKSKTVPSFLELEQKGTDLVMLNTHYSTDFARALPPNVIQVGGLQLWEPRIQKIPDVIQTFMDGAKDGVFLMALGTSYDISHTNSRFRRVFWETVRAFPDVRFVFTWEGDQPDDTPENLLLSSWLPQREIMGHPKMKGFISHCGLYSIAEATYYGIPIIGIPLVADEDYDAYRIEMEEIGVRLEAKTINVEDFKHAVSEILGNEKYTKNMKKMSTLLKDRPTNPIETGVWWTDYVLRNEDIRSLRPRSVDLSWIQLRGIDVHAFLLLCASILTFLIIKLTHKLVEFATKKTVK